MACNFRPYEGNEKYIFISYAHADGDRVYPILERLNEAGYRVWYDEGIDWGTEWPDAIASHIDNCEVVIAFHSEASKISEFCKREINYATNYVKKSILSVFLEEVKFNSGMVMQLSLYQSTCWYQYEDKTAFYSRLFETDILQPCRETAAKNYDDILVSGSGNPYFDPVTDVVIVDTGKCLYLAPPKSGRNNPENAEFNFAREDTLCVDLSLPDVDQRWFDGALESTKEEVHDKLLRHKDGFHFNGKNYGISYFRSHDKTSGCEHPKLEYELYNTDFYTRMVLERMMDKSRRSLPAITPAKINSRDFPLFRPSIGITLIVVLRSTNQIILTKRSLESVYADGTEWYYVSVTESLTEDDKDEESKAPSLVKCAQRGMLKELNIRPDMYDIGTLKIYDTFYETHFFQDGIVMSVELNDDVNLKDIDLCCEEDRNYVAEFLFIENSKNAIKDFIADHKPKMRAQTIFALESYASRLP